MKNIFKNWPLITSISMFLILIALLSMLSAKKNQGNFIYVLDDPYIHMAMAKNVIENTVWGVTKYGFTSSSSSPFWVLLLSSFYILFGINNIAPFILNILFGIINLNLGFFLLKKYGLPPAYNFIVLLALIFFTPMTVLVFGGQEHIWHMFLTILVAFLSAKILSDEKPTLKNQLLLLVLISFTTITRYEGLFLVFILTFLFILRKRIKQAIILWVTGFFPIAIYGAISVRMGWYFLPNPVLLKGKSPDISSLKGIVELLGYNAYRQIENNSHLLLLLITALFVFIILYQGQKNIWRDSILAIIIFIGVTLLHLQFAATGWFYRYEAYLVGLGLIVITIGIHECLSGYNTINFMNLRNPAFIAMALALMLFLCPFYVRGKDSLRKINQATTNIFKQQYQMSLFLKKFYKGQSVAANDIGCINFVADIDCLDLDGLANIKVAQLKRNGKYDREQINKLAKEKRVKIAILYDEWFKKEGLPSQWIMVGKWKISDNIVCGSDTVSFYSVDYSEKEKLIKNLQTFSSELPRDLIQTGPFVDKKKVL